MRHRRLPLLLLLALLPACASSAGAPAMAGDARAGGADEVGRHGWLHWRGPAQNGTSPETGLVDAVELGGEGHLWTYPVSGRGAPVVAGGRVFGIGYQGEGKELEESLFCLDERTGELLWEHRWADMFSDVIYSRYAIGSPTVDPATGNVFALGTNGLLMAFTPTGEKLWEVSMVEALGRLSFPNGRTGAPTIVGDLVVAHFIFAAWGPLGPASDRFYGFDKHTGEVVWYSTPGVRPVDSSFSSPVLEARDGRTVFYATLGDGNVAAVDARTGDPLWRFPLAHGGLNSSPLLHGDTLIAVNGKENLGDTGTGRMIALDLTATPGDDGALPASAERWRNDDMVAFTSSPVLVGDRVYLTGATGELHCVDANDGRQLWHLKLGPDQLHASPLYADGKLYVPITNGTFYVVRPSDEGGEVLDAEQLAGSCLGAPSVANGRVYVHTTEALYCFGDAERELAGAPLFEPRPRDFPDGEPARLAFVPSDVTFRAGAEEVPFRVRELDAHGNVLREVPGSEVAFEKPPFIGTTLDWEWTASKTGVAMVKGTAGGLGGPPARLRMVPTLPLEEDFEATTLDQGEGTWAWPPGHWLGARMKWQIVEKDGSKVAARRLDNPLFQRTISLFGHPDDADYTMQVDLMTDGSRRSMSSAGVIHQRYQIALKGNYQELEVSSNMEHLKESVRCRVTPGVWYTMKTRVDVQADGAALVRAKVWPRDEVEPETWTIEVTDPHGHTHGAAGLYGFTPQSRYAVYLDNLSVTPNE